MRSYNAAITRRAKELSNAGLDHLIDYLPPKTTVRAVRERIATVNDFRRIVGYANDRKKGRPSELDRVLKSVRPDALDFGESADGKPITNYQAREGRYNRRAIERARRKSRDDMSRSLFDGDTAVDLDSLSDAELLTVNANTDLGLDAGVPDDSVIDVDDATLARWLYEDDQRKRTQVEVPNMVYAYLDVWMNPLNHHDMMGGYQTLIDAMRWLEANRPDVLVKMFNMGHDELDPLYITESGGTGNPYINIDYEVRHHRAIGVVTRYARGAGWIG